MKPNIARTIFFATIGLALTAVASAQDDRACSNAAVAGEWGYAFTGSLITANGAVPMASVGKVTLDAGGNFSGTQTSSTGGSVSEDTVKGTYVVNSDCTGTLTVMIYDKPGTTLLRTAQWTMLIDDNASEMRAIVTSLVQAGGASVPAITTMNAQKLFPVRQIRLVL